MPRAPSEFSVAVPRAPPPQARVGSPPTCDAETATTRPRRWPTCHGRQRACGRVSTSPMWRDCKLDCTEKHVGRTAAFPRDAARLRGVLRVLREWVLARSAPASPLARACALHLLCRDAGFLHDAGMMVLACVVGGGACRYGCARALRARSMPQGCSLHALLHNTGSYMTPNDLCHGAGS